MGKNNTLHADDHSQNPPNPMNQRFTAHANSPQNMGGMGSPDGMATGTGTCGDAITVCISVHGDRIVDIRQLPRGCIYTVACGSAMSSLAKGKSLAGALAINPEDVAGELGGLPADHMHCAALAINTLGEAIDDYYRKIWGKAD